MLRFDEERRVDSREPEGSEVAERGAGEEGLERGRGTEARALETLKVGGRFGVRVWCVSVDISWICSPCTQMSIWVNLC